MAIMYLRICLFFVLSVPVAPCLMRPIRVRTLNFMKLKFWSKKFGNIPTPGGKFVYWSKLN